MADKLKIALLAFVLIFIGVQAILNGEIPARSGRGLTPGVTSFPFVEPHVVSFVGWIFILAGGYLFARALYYGKKK